MEIITNNIKETLDDVIKLLTVKEYCRLEKLNLFLTCKAFNKCKPSAYLVLTKNGVLRFIGDLTPELLEQFEAKIKSNILKLKLKLEC